MRPLYPKKIRPVKWGSPGDADQHNLKKSRGKRLKQKFPTKIRWIMGKNSNITDKTKVSPKGRRRAKGG